MPEKISILKESGETLNSNIVSVFMIPDTEKKYIITTENAVDPHGLTVLHVSEIVDGSLQKIATDEEWSSIKTIMRAIISGNVGPYQYLPIIENINASGQYSRDISVSASASKQMIDNYNAGEKNAVVSAQPQAQVQQENNTALPNQPTDGSPLGGVSPTAQHSQPIQPSSIFPANNNVGNSDDELIPGISEVTAQSPDASQVNSVNLNVSQNNVGENTFGVQPTSVSPVQPVSGVTPNTQQIPVLTEQIIQQPVSNLQVVQGMGMPASSLPLEPVNNLPANDILNNTSGGMGMGVENIQIPNGVPSTVAPVVSPVETNLDGAKQEVQVVLPTQTVPTSQIAQGTQNPISTEIKLDNNIKPSFEPNASLDEVVLGAQEMFMEGVKNLVQTIQEKVYRDLYNKEAELKSREAILEQREKMLNDQMMAMMGNFGMLQNNVQTPQLGPKVAAQVVPPVPPVSNMVPPMVDGPTIVSASNDSI